MKIENKPNLVLGATYQDPAGHSWQVISVSGWINDYPVIAECVGTGELITLTPDGRRDGKKPVWFLQENAKTEHEEIQAKITARNTETWEQKQARWNKEKLPASVVIPFAIFNYKNTVELGAMINRVIADCYNEHIESWDIDELLTAADALDLATTITKD